MTGFDPDELQGSGYDPSARGHERQGRDPLPPALREARDRVAAKIKDRMPGCPLPDCLACRSNLRKATALASEAVVAALRWADELYGEEPGCLLCSVIATLERDAAND